MPVYEYVCEKCETKTEALRPMRDADEPLACARCGSREVKRVHSVFAAASATAGGESGPMSGGSGGPGGCGRCGDPRGSCGM